MRVIMLIEVKTETDMETIYSHLQDGVDADRVEGYFTLVKDGESQADDLPEYMMDEKRLSEWVANFEKVIINNPTFKMASEGPDGERFNAMQD